MKKREMASWPNNVGIKAIEVNFPYLYVDQSKLEFYDKVSQGKYTIGLGQEKMGFCGDQEDINSLCLTVVHNLMEKHHIDAKDVGRLEVGTETLIDKSKSVKTVLMQLFENSNNTDIEGIDTTNACFGGTSALFNAVNWVESTSWDGRLAIVVLADIAVYAAGNARPTGGAGSIALVVGPDAPLVFDCGLRAFHMAHVYDFYKPNMSSEYPVIDGQLSIKCFLSALDTCYERYCQKYEKKMKLKEPLTLKHIDYLIFHTPYCKMVKKAVGRCFLNDFIKSRNNNVNDGCSRLQDKYKHITLQSTLDDPILFKEIEKETVQLSSTAYKEKTDSSILLAKNIGNMYTPSLYSCLISLLINNSLDELIGKQIVLFSYGSGLASCMFSLSICPESSLEKSFHSLLNGLEDIHNKLSARKEVEPENFIQMLETREKIMKCKEYIPSCSPENLFLGTYYLTKIDEKYRRFYERKVSQVNGFAKDSILMDSS